MCPGGLVLSEGGGIGTLVYEGLAPTQKEAGALALAAGVDVGISFESGYMKDLVANVRGGKVSTNLMTVQCGGILPTASPLAKSAGYQPAIQQTGSLRY